ncbi:hypothetical protein KOW79_020874 [Hemibagrus wyckioides]|uniref:Fibronectin type-III domain-containing protein n=1 Tax=Hemibagrus wyckioides TaxID=337641 RepID=A0A9D3SDN6_9TELE|nr:interferon gamma receptor 1 [Hemibagrus wyckioides]KAG7316008.1 hypothetical protein KOW79_020874 [Hemibagrus wyckioides]
MRLITPGVLTVFTVLTRLTHAVPAPSDVSVKCDSNGAVVEWTAAGLSEQADFELEIKTNFGKNITVHTKSRHLDLSSLLDDPGYNFYVVKVKARDGKQESEFAVSPTFSFNALMRANITCSLEFPEVTVFPQDGQLFVQFANPLHLYRDTLALRGLLKSDTLEYVLYRDEIPEEVTCVHESKMCESNISFPENQEKYCVTLVGFIRQTPLRRTEPYCHYGQLYPVPPLSTYLVPLLVSFAVFVTLALVSVFLVKRMKKNLKEDIHSMFPEFLKSKTPLIEFLSVVPDPVSPEVNLVDKDPPHMTLDIQESTTPSETTHSSQCTEEEDDDELTNSGSSESMDSLCKYGKAEDLSGSNLSSGYDRPHALLEMSPGDMVQNYKC